MDVITKFINKSTVLVRAYVYDEDDKLTDPSVGGSVKVVIVDPNGVTKIPSEGNDDVMTQHDSTTGVYDYFYDTDEDSAEGWWNGEVWVIDGNGAGAKTSVGVFSFEVKKGL